MEETAEVLKVCPMTVMRDWSAAWAWPNLRMNPERWKEIDALLQAALRLLADQREEFARKTCSGDMALESKRSQSKWRRERLLGLEIPK